MPKYRVTLSDGRVVTVEADQPPTEAEVLSVISEPFVPDVRRAGEGQRRIPEAMGGPTAGRGPGGYDPRRSQENAVEGLPTGGATAGSLVGGGLGFAYGGPPGYKAGSVAGAGLGGSIGKTGQFMLRGETPNWGQVLEEGTKQAGAEAAFGIAGRLARPVGKVVYRGGVALLPKNLKQEFTNLAEAGYRERIPLTRRGADRADALAGQSSAEADRILNQFAAMHPPTQVHPPMAPSGMVSQADAFRFVPETEQKFLGGSLGANDPRLGKYADLTEKARTGREWPIDVVEANRMKQVEQEIAHNARRAAERGNKPQIGTRALFAKDVSKGLQASIEDLVPEVAPVNARTRDLIGLQRAASHAGETGHILSRMTGAGTGVLTGAGMAGVPGAALGLGAGAILTTPAGLSRTALAIQRYGPMLAQVPQSFRAVLLAQLMAEEDKPR